MADRDIHVERLADWLWCLRLPLVQLYAVREGAGFNLVDTGTRGEEDAILGALAAIDGTAPGDVRVHEILLTHGHDDHAGSAAALVARTGARLLGTERDRPYTERERPVPDPVLAAWEVPLYAQARAAVPRAPAATLDATVAPGDVLAWERPVTILAAPGHTPGHVAAHVAGERALIAGDAIGSFRGEPMPGVFNVDPAESVASFLALAELDVDLACFGHGDAIAGDAGARLRRAAAAIRAAR